MALAIQKRVWEIVEVAAPGDRLSKLFDISILILISFNVLAVILESVQSLQAKYALLFSSFEIFSVAVFTIEYLSRIWSCVIDPRFNKAVTGRLKFAFHPMAIIDLLAILPFYLPFVGFDLRFIRVLRLFRIIRVAKIGRYYSSLQLIKNVFISKKEELVLTSFVMVLLLIIAANIMFYCENAVQPDAFPNIPATMWWAVATLTTVGYGDIYPVTVIGKLFASIIAILGIGMFALPTGILGAGFVEEIQKRNRKNTKCPHCGKELPDNIS